MATKGKAENKKTEAQTSAAQSYASAMDKLRDEMAKNGNLYVQRVGEYLTNYLLEHPEAEAALMDSAKTITGSLQSIETKARKNKVGNVGIVDDITAFRLVLGYFGIAEGTGNGQPGTAPSPAHEPVGATPRGRPSPAPEPDPFDLDALLGVG